MKREQAENGMRQSMGMLNEDQQSYERMVTETAQNDTSVIPDMSDIFNQIEQVKYAPEEESRVEKPVAVEKEKGDTEEIIVEPEEDTSEGIEIAEEPENEEPQEVIEFDAEPKEEKKKKSNSYRKAQIDRFRANAERDAALDRVAQLEQMLTESLNSGTYHYGKYAYAELDKAKEDLRKAIDEGDREEFVNATIALTNANNAVREIEKWANSNSSTSRTQYQEPMYEQPLEPSPEEIHREIAEDWLENHPYLKPQSTNYNPEVANKVMGFVNNLDSHLAKSNQMNRYFSDEYFNTIDNYIRSINQKPQSVQKTQAVSKNIQSFSNAGAVRTNGSTSMNGNKIAPTQRVVLDADEKQICANLNNLLGITEKDWAKHKAHYAGGKRA